MQTLLTKVSVLMSRTTTVVVFILSVNEVGYAIFQPKSKVLAAITTMLDYSAVLLFYPTLLFVVVTKYMLIYHGSLIENISEERLLSRFKIFLGGFVLFGVFIQYTFITDVQESGTFQLRYLGYVTSNSKVEVGIPLLVFTTVISLAILQVRLEIDCYHSEDKDSGLLGKLMKLKRESKEEIQNIGYSLKVFRGLMFVCLLMSVVMLYQTFRGGQDRKWNKMILVTTIAGVIPIIFISKHDGMKTIAKKKVRWFQNGTLFSVTV